MLDIIERLALLRHTSDAAGDAQREVEDLHERLAENLALTGEMEPGALEMALYKRAKNSLQDAMRFVEDFEKLGGLD